MNIVEHLRYRARTRNTGRIISSEDTETMGYYGAGSAKFDNDTADRIEALEAALRAIADPDNCLMISEMEDLARDALASEQDK